MLFGVSKFAICYQIGITELKEESRGKSVGGYWGGWTRPQFLLCLLSDLSFFARFGIWVLLNWWVWCESETGSWILAELAWVSGLNSLSGVFRFVVWSMKDAISLNWIWGYPFCIGFWICGVCLILQIRFGSYCLVLVFPICISIHSINNLWVLVVFWNTAHAFHSIALDFYPEQVI